MTELAGVAHFTIPVSNLERSSRLLNIVQLK
jgi:hypothetical protein